SPNIIRISNGGATVTNPWVTLPTTGMVSALYVDRTGAFGNKLLAVVGAGGQSPNASVWQIDASGSATQLASYASNAMGVVQGEVGMFTVPNTPTLYGPLAGKLVIVQDGATAVTIGSDPSHTVGHPTGPPTSYPGYGGSTPSATGLDNAEGGAIVPATPANFFAMADSQQLIAVADGSQFATIQNQIIVAHEGSWFDRIWYDGTYLQTQRLQFTADSNLNQPWYEDAFAPLGLGPVAAPPFEPGLP